MFINPKRIPSTGSQAIDASHTRLAQLINLAYDLWQSGADRNDLADAMREFVRGVGLHFSEEISLIRDAGYADWQAHENIHREFHRNLVKFLSDLEEGKGEFNQETFDLLDQLLYEHEFLDDQDFWEVFQGEKQALPAGEPLITWSDDFSVQHADIDSQHKALVKLVNRLYLTVAGKADKSEIISQLDEVLKHTKKHFSFEENLMEKHGLNGSASHRVLHESLLADLTGVLADFDVDKYELLGDLIENYLKYWLLDHIVHVDKGLGRLLSRVDNN